ncbi:MAG: sulfotransferase [Bryobacteraceae bacterium]
MTLILLSGGRNGSTWLMSMLASDPRVAFDLVFPYEARYLTYIAQFSRLFENREFAYSLTPGPATFAGLGEGRFPESPAWKPRTSPEAQIPVPDRRQWFSGMWRMFDEHLRKSRPGTDFYAEKVLVWVPHMVREFFPSRTIYLFRDPRDVYISANAFMKKGDYYGFERRSGDSDLDHARSLCVSFLIYVTNYLADRRRDDCLLLRYEDLVGNTKAALAPLEAATGLMLDAGAGAQHFRSHGTAPSVALSEGRWRREGLPKGVGEFFERTAGGELVRLGYPSMPPAGHSAFPSVDFGLGGVDLDALAISPDGRFERSSDGYASIHLSGSDFWMVLPLEPVQAEEVTEIWLCVKGGGGDHCSVYWLGPGGTLGEDCAIHVFYQPSQHWHIIRFRVSAHPAWSGEIRVVRLDLFNSACGGSLDGHGEIQWVRLVG